MSEHETITDIIAEMRALSNPISDGIIAINGRIIADRFDAAHKRESGNAAKLREALEEVLDDYQDDCAISRMIHTALAAPARNCDLSKVVEDPWRAWLDDESNWEDGNPKLEIHDWLLAPATAKEGGNDAD